MHSTTKTRSRSKGGALRNPGDMSSPPVLHESSVANHGGRDRSMHHANDRIQPNRATQATGMFVNRNMDPNNALGKKDVRRGPRGSSNRRTVNDANGFVPPTFTSRAPHTNTQMAPMGVGIDDMGSGLQATTHSLQSPAPYSAHLPPPPHFESSSDCIERYDHCPKRDPCIPDCRPRHDECNPHNLLLAIPDVGSFELTQNILNQIENYLLNSNTFITRLIQILIDAGMGGDSGLVPERTVFVSPSWMPATPSPPTTQTPFFNTIDAAVNWIHLNRAAITEVWGVIIYPGVYGDNALMQNGANILSTKDTPSNIRESHKALSLECATYIDHLTKLGRQISNFFEFEKDRAQRVLESTLARVQRECVDNRKVAKATPTKGRNKNKQREKEKETENNDESVFVKEQRARCEQFVTRINVEISKTIAGLRSATAHLGNLYTDTTPVQKNTQRVNVNKNTAPVRKSDQRDNIVNRNNNNIDKNKATRPRRSAARDTKQPAALAGVPLTIEPNIHFSAAVPGSVFVYNNWTFDSRSTPPTAHFGDSFNLVTGINFVGGNLTWDMSTSSSTATDYNKLTFNNCNMLGRIEDDIAYVGAVHVQGFGQISTTQNHMVWQNSNFVIATSWLIENLYGQIVFENVALAIIQTFTTDSVGTFVTACPIFAIETMNFRQAAWGNAAVLSSSICSVGTIDNTSKNSITEMSVVGCIAQGFNVQNSLFGAAIALRLQMYGSFLMHPSTPNYPHIFSFIASNCLIQGDLIFLTGIQLGLTDTWVRGDIDIRLAERVNMPSSYLQLFNSSASSVIISDSTVSPPTSIAAAFQFVGAHVDRLTLTESALVTTTVQNINMSIKNSTINTFEAFRSRTNVEISASEIGLLHIGRDNGHPTFPTEFIRFRSSNTHFARIFGSENENGFMPTDIDLLVAGGSIGQFNSSTGANWKVFVTGTGVATFPASSGTTPHRWTFANPNSQYFLRGVEAQPLAANASNPTALTFEVADNTEVELDQCNFSFLTVNVVGIATSNYNALFSISACQFNELTWTQTAAATALLSRLSIKLCDINAAIVTSPNTSLQIFGSTFDTLTTNAAWTNDTNTNVIAPQKILDSEINTLVLNNIPTPNLTKPAFEIQRCGIDSLTDAMIHHKIYDNCSLRTVTQNMTRLAVAPPDMAAYRVPTEEFNNCAIDTLFYNSYSIVSVNNSNVTTSFTYNWRSPSFTAAVPVSKNIGALNVFNSVMRDLNLTSNQTLSNAAYFRFYISGSEIYHDLNVTSMPVAPNGSASTGVPYNLDTASGPAVILDCRIGNLNIVPTIPAALFPTQDWGLTRTALRSGNVTSGTVPSAGLKLNTHGNLTPATFVPAASVDVIPYTVPTPTARYF